MKLTTLFTARFQTTVARVAKSTGPVQIDPRDFKFIAGGSPKGGWAAENAQTLQSPKGGW
jgi:hypothetical protein